MTSQLQLDDFTIDVVRKNIKHLYLRVLPPTGKVRISAPRRMETETIRLFAVSRLGWIKKQQNKFLAQERETPRGYLDGESHFAWGLRHTSFAMRFQCSKSTDDYPTPHR